MGKFILPLGLILLGLITGQVIRHIETNKFKRANEDTPNYIIIIRNLALYILNPFIAIGVFWAIPLNDIKLIALPGLGLFALTTGGILALLASKFLKHDRIKKGSMFVSGSFTNLGTFGSIICFAFFGEMSLAFVYMYKLFEEVYYFLIGYPIAKMIGGGNKEQKSLFKTIFSDPFVLVNLGSIAIGVTLNLCGIKRPVLYADINSLLIPAASVLLIAAVGYTMKMGKIKNYLKECLIISVIKFLVMPVLITGAAYLLGIGLIHNGLVLKIVLVMSALPPAFNSLIPPQLYELDIDLANSTWIFNTGMLIIVLPLLSIFV